jgi:hypothetical protein
MLTKKDIELLLEHFVTRTEFENAITRIEEKMVTKEEISASHNSIMSTLDAVLGEVKAMRQEQIINSHRFDDTDKEIGGLKKRVTKLEEHSSIPHP